LLLSKLNRGKIILRKNKYFVATTLKQNQIDINIHYDTKVKRTCKQKIFKSLHTYFFYVTRSVCLFILKILNREYNLLDTLNGLFYIALSKNSEEGHSKKINIDEIFGILERNLR